MSRKGAQSAPGYTPEFLTGVASAPSLVRNVVVVGALHHGKTMLVDRLIDMGRSHADNKVNRRSEGATDVLDAEQARGMSLTARPAQCLAPDARGKWWNINALGAALPFNFFSVLLLTLYLSLFSFSVSLSLITHTHTHSLQTRRDTRRWRARRAQQCGWRTA